MRGRKPKPTSQRRLDGNPGHRPLNMDEPTTPALEEDFDKPPAELDEAPIAQAEWRRLAPLLRKARHVSATDRTALIAACLEWSEYLEAMSKVRALGRVVRTPQGYPMTNPYRTIATKALAACNKLWPELGLTPSSRSRITTTGIASPDDPFAEFDDPPPAIRSGRPARLSSTSTTRSWRGTASSRPRPTWGSRSSTSSTRMARRSWPCGAAA
jgi:P27 family predicted phage terminase small subunit